jgi:hypothetical protein
LLGQRLRLTFDFSRVPSIMEERASTYQALFFRSLQIEGVFPDRNTIHVSRFATSMRSGGTI